LNFSDACIALEELLRARPGIVEGILARKGDDPFKRLGTAMRSHTFQTGDGTLSAQKLVADYDERSQREGLHLLHAWDFQAHVFSRDPAPALLVEHCARLQRKADPRVAVGVLLDVYMYALLALLAARAWDEGDAGSNLDRVTLLIHLARQEGSGLAYVDDAETLLFLAASYFHPEECSYDTLLGRVKELPLRQQLRMAASSGAMLSAHLRWGFRYMYDRDIKRMRDDNAADYPWVRFAVEALASDAASKEALLVALAADPWETVPHVRSSRPLDTQALESLQPKSGEFSPLSVAFNFPSNAAVALVAVTLEDSRFYPSLNALFSRESGAAGTATAERLMKYSAGNPTRLGAGRVPLIVYDPTEGARAWNAISRELR
jgi:hypothetical protein